MIPSANSCKKKQKQRYSHFPDVGREVGASTKCRFQTRAFLTTYKVTDFVLIRTFVLFSLWKPAVWCFNWGIREAALNHFSRWEVTRGVKKKTNKFNSQNKQLSREEHQGYSRCTSIFENRWVTSNPDNETQGVNEIINLESRWRNLLTQLERTR